VAGIQLSGTATSINAAIAGATFTATAAGAASIGIEVSDGTDTATGSYQFTASSTTAPTATGLPASVTVTEDVASPVDLSTLSVGDVNGDTLTLTLVADSGTLAAASGAGVSVVGNGTGSLSLSGSAASLNAYLANSGNVQYSSALNDNGQRSIAVSVSDGITPAVNVGTTTVHITAVKDAPTLSGLPGTAQSVETGVAADLADFTVVDVDNSGVQFTVTLTPTNGSLNGLTDADTGTAGIQVTGTAAEVNAAIAGATFTATAAGAASVGIEVSDGTDTATGSYQFTAEAPPPTDNDGVSDEEEDATPGLTQPDGSTAVAGDGNGDGIKDSQQDRVTSTTFLLTTTAESKPDGAPPTFVTLVADSLGGKTDPDAGNASITGVVQKDAPADLPPGMNAPLGLIGFIANIDNPGGSETFSLYVDLSVGANGYWKQDASGTWINLASEPYGGQMVTEGDRLRLDFVIEDGGQFDADGLANGSIADPGAVGNMAQSIVDYQSKPPSVFDYQPKLPLDDFWF
jgi:hypothetical protein